MTTDEERGARLQAAQAADPQTHPWGIRTSDPFPAGLTMFFWYESEDALCEALLSGDHVLDADDDTRSQVVEALRRVLETSRPLTPTSADAGNRAAFPAFNIHWWGTFDDLCHGGHEDAQEARLAFFEASDEDYAPDADAPAIPPGARADFAGFIGEWGF